MCVILTQYRQTVTLNKNQRTSVLCLTLSTGMEQTRT